MAKNINEAMSETGEAIKSGAQSTGRILAQGAHDMAEGAKEMMGIDSDKSFVKDITEHMPVIASCGATIGMVDNLDGNEIKLTRKDSPDGHHHFIPLSWVSRVDSHVHLNVNSAEAQLNWR